MAENSKISWTHHTFNPWEGCQKVSSGCDHCYAEARNARFSHGIAVNFGVDAPRRRTSEANWKLPLKWNKQARMKGLRYKVFCASLADVFDNAVPEQWRFDLFKLIEQTPHLDWLLLTKRIGNATAMLEKTIRALTAGREGWADNYFPNVWIGATIVNQEEADRDIPKLMQVRAAKRFLSMEPLLGAVDLSQWLDIIQDEDGAPWGRRNIGHLHDMLDWVIVGGESGPRARPMHPDWATSLRDQCKAAGVPFFFKQWGEWHTAAFIGSTGEAVFRKFGSFQQWVNKASTWVQGGICVDADGRELKNGADMQRARDERKFPVTIMHRVGKKAAGRLLDGKLHDAFPKLDEAQP